VPYSQEQNSVRLAGDIIAHEPRLGAGQTTSLIHVFDPGLFSLKRRRDTRKIVLADVQGHIRDPLNDLLGADRIVATKNSESG
jgi:hypothetical protein